MNENYTVTRTSSEAMTKLQEKRNQTNRTMLCMVFGVFLLFIPPVGIIFILFMCWRVSNLRKEMKGLYKDAFVREPLANNFQNVIYEPAKGFTLDNVKSFGICRTGNSFWSEDYIRATYAGINFEVAEVRLIDVDTSSDSNRSETLFEGRMMVFDFPNKLVSTVSVFSKKFKHRVLSRNEEKQYRVELEDIRFNNEFDTFSLVQLDAFYLITPHMMERLQVLRSKYESIGMNVIGNRVILAFNEPGKNVFDQNIDVGKLDIEKEMAKVQGEIDDIKLFISMILNLRANG